MANDPLQEIMKYRKEVEQHFSEEQTNKKKLFEIEQKIEKIKLSNLSKTTEMTNIIKEKGRDSLQANII